MTTPSIPDTCELRISESLFDFNAAVFSKCGVYRYALWRVWSDTPPCAFICLNPSTATESENDPTVRRCIGFSHRWGHGGFIMLNLFGVRATDPRDMLSHPEPVGADNDHFIRECSASSGQVVAAWGTKGEHLNRDADVRRLVPDLRCLRLTKNGHPEHPLYVPGNIQLMAYAKRGGAWGR